MKKIFISGSIELKMLHKTIIASLDKLIAKKYKIIVGDAYGIDQKVQQYLSKKKYYNVVVYSIFSKPRVICSNKFNIQEVDHDSTLKSEREKQTFKDIKMTEDSNITFVIWDGKSNGSYNNIIRAIDLKKEIQVFLDNSFLEKKDITKENITRIFNERHEYSLTKYLNDVLKEKNQNQIKNTKQMKETLKQKGILTGNNSYDGKYEKFITIKNIRGRQVVKYKKSLLDDCFSEIIKKEKEQISLF